MSSSGMSFMKINPQRRQHRLRDDVRCRQLTRHRRRKCHRQIQRSSSDYLEAPTTAATAEKTSIEPVSPSTTTDNSPWIQDIGVHFAQMADAFAQSLYDTRVRYNQAAAAAMPSQACPKVSSPVACARQELRGNQCWTVGSRDGCKDSAVCCFNGCENVCFHPASVTVRPQEEPQTFDTHNPSSGGVCPRRPSRPPQDCQSARPNCWSSGTYDLDCPNSGLCCFDGCVNRCLVENEAPAVVPVNSSQVGQREPSLILHIYGPPQGGDALVQFGHLPPSNRRAVVPRGQRRSDLPQCPNQGNNNVCQRGVVECYSDSDCVDQQHHFCCFDGCGHKCQHKPIVRCPYQRPRCHVALHDECRASSDCASSVAFGPSQCCFDGCVNACARGGRDMATNVHTALYNYFYGQQRRKR
jgi:hypothetical protein